MTPYQIRKLQEAPEKALKMLRAIAAKAEIRSQLMSVGYTAEDQQEGWDLLLQASGYPPSLAPNSDDARVREAIAKLDAWSERGFARVHAALLRFHPEQAEFVFAGLRGASSLLSVSKLLRRLHRLQADPAREATRVADQLALATLEKRGITVQLRQELADLTELAQSAAPVPQPQPTDAAQEQQQALIELSKWVEDWAETARAVITRRDYLIMLGLRRPRRSNQTPPTPSLKAEQDQPARETFVNPKTSTQGSEE